MHAKPVSNPTEPLEMCSWSHLQLPPYTKKKEHVVIEGTKEGSHFTSSGTTKRLIGGSLGFLGTYNSTIIEFTKPLRSTIATTLTIDMAIILIVKMLLNFLHKSLRRLMS